MRRALVLLLPALSLSAGLSACEEPSVKHNKRHKAPGEDFQFDHSVHITSPTNGETVDGAFVVTFEAGADVALVRLSVDNTRADSVDVTNVDDGRFAVTADVGRHAVRVEGVDADGALVSEHQITLRVADDQPWVTITSPSDGDTTPNPVRFTVSASDDVDSVEFLADGWSLGTAEPGGWLTYEFAGTGFEREVEARAWDGDTLVATDTITLTVDASSNTTESVFNDHVLALMDDYPTDGSYAYWWPTSGDWAGNPSDLYYLDRLFAAGDPEHRSFCVGLTFEVFMRAIVEVDQEWGGDGSINGISFDELYEFRTDWYVRDLYGAGVVDAVETYGIGQRVHDWDDARPGDYVQFWRHSGSGHNVVFVDWERDSSDAIIGFTYWSTQGSTDGVGYNDEYFGSSGSRVDPNLFFLARVQSPDDWQPWQ